MITCDAITIKFYRIMFDKFYFLNNGDVQFEQSRNKGAAPKKTSPFWEEFQKQLGKRFTDLIWVSIMILLISFL